MGEQQLGRVADFFIAIVHQLLRSSLLLRLEAAIGEPFPTFAQLRLALVLETLAASQ